MSPVPPANLNDGNGADRRNAVPYSCGTVIIESHIFMVSNNGITDDVKLISAIITQTSRKI